MRRAAAFVAITMLVGLVGAACERPPAATVAAWPSDCAPPAAPMAPLGMEAARAAHREAELRHELQLRETVDPGFFRRATASALDPNALAAGALCLDDVTELGRLVFEHEYGFADGLGSGKARENARGPFRRIHDGLFGGPETIGCRSCHWVGGPNGAGAETDNVFLQGDGATVASADQRNPPALVALGVVEALAREMSADLQRQRAALVREAKNAGAPRGAALVAKGIDFGELRVSAAGEVDTSLLRGVDADLVVKPFGWKGVRATVADFAGEALQIHLGVQSAALLATGTPELFGSGDRNDPDGDGVVDEIAPGPFAAMIAHLAVQELPIVEPFVQDRPLPPAAEGMYAPTTTSFVDDFERGRKQFHALGCAECHRPMLVLEHPVVTIAGLPPIDLVRSMHRPALVYDAALGGYPVWLFSDLRRHDMGAANAARYRQRGVGERDYVTPRLWGVADSAPYLHDGRAPSFDYAIAGHDGEGAAARDAFFALPLDERGPLRVYLMSLRRAPRVMVP